MTFEHPGFFALAAVATLVLALLYRALERRRSGQAFAYSNVEFVTGALGPAKAIGAALFAGWLVGAGALAVALAGPHFTARVPFKDGSVMLAIDTSGSMTATDVAPTRGAAARAAAHAFVNAVPDGTRVGVVSFSSSAALVQAPSADRDDVNAAIDKIPLPAGATAIGDALTLAAQQLPETGRRVIVLLTDGVNNRGVDPVEASQSIGRAGIAIYTVGVGSNAGELIPGTLERAELDEDALRTVAQNANGTYIPAADAQTLEDSFRDLARNTVWETKRVDGSLTFALAGGALVVLTTLAALSAGRFP